VHGGFNAVAWRPTAPANEFPGYFTAYEGVLAARPLVAGGILFNFIAPKHQPK
jgi:hypothetical protein